MYVPFGWLLCLALYLVTLGVIGTSNLFGGLNFQPVLLPGIFAGLALLVAGPYYAWMRWDMETTVSAARDKALLRPTAFISYFIPERNMDEWRAMVLNVALSQAKVQATGHSPVPAWEPYWKAHLRLIDQNNQARACLWLIDQAEARLDEMQRTWVVELLEMYPDQIKQAMPDARDERAMARHFRKHLEQELQGLAVIRECADHLLKNHKRTRHNWQSVVTALNEIPQLIQAAQELQPVRPS